MVDVYKHTQYCNASGRGYLMPTYNEAVARERADGNRSDWVAQLLRLAREARGDDQFSEQQSFIFQRFSANPLVRGFQQTVLYALRPFEMLANAMIALPQAPVPLPFPIPAFLATLSAQWGLQLNATIGKVVSFFFGYKKENDRGEERQQREKADFATSDVFTRFVVVETNHSRMGGGGR
ncbi:MAG: hypothetical protein IPK79_09110 [Vampirovibrionales bacterium]|nr:hypothetical protein [Vampirovibrionales bacterium]